jgi:hypothetical protein
MRRVSVCIACIVVLALVAHGAYALDKITGPWLFVIAPTDAGQGGRDSIAKDQLAAATNNAVTEAAIAKAGAKEGDAVGKFKWTSLEIPATGGDNVNPIANKLGVAGDVNDHSSYAVITLKVAAATRTIATVGSDDAVKAWLNGDVVWENPVNRGAGDFQDRFKVNLKAGDNIFMVKVSERGGGWSMFAGVNADFTAAGKTYKSDPAFPTFAAAFPRPKAGPKIEGPWLFMIAPTPAGQGGRDSTEKDQLADASGGAVTEEKIAVEGAREGASVGKFKWTKMKIAPTGGNNMNDVANALGAAGDVNDHSSYAYIVLVSPDAKTTQLHVGSDDSVKVWLNGAVVWSNPVNRGAGDVQEAFDIALMPGFNKLLVKVSERGGGWSMFVALNDGVTLDMATPVSPAGSKVTTWGAIKAR